MVKSKEKELKKRKSDSKRMFYSVSRVELNVDEDGRGLYRYFASCCTFS